MFKILEEIEQVGSTLKKAELLEQHLTNDLEKYLRLTLGDDILNIADKSIENALNIKTKDKFKDIGVKLENWLSTHKGRQVGLDAFFNLEKNKKNTFNDFVILFEQLKELRGNDSLYILKRFFENTKPNDAKWFARCLIRNLNIGMSVISINKVFEKKGLELIKIFDLSLCESIDTSTDNIIKEQLDKLLIEHKVLQGGYKYDGVRLDLNNFKACKAISRNGKPILSMPALIDELEKCFSVPIELDGEVVGTNFNALMTQINRKDNFKDVGIKFKVFDILSYNGEDYTIKSFNERREKLVELFLNIDSELIELIDNEKFNNSEDIIKYYYDALDKGMEGIVIKNNSIYTRDRKNWWKIKPFKTADLKITKLHYGTGMYAKLISSISVVDKSGTVVSNVGTGLDDDMRNYLTEHQEECIGKIVEIGYDYITPKNKDGIRSFRFPRFVCIREDKDEPDIL